MSPQATTLSLMRSWPTDDGVVALGGDYNPEQWPQEVWRHDVDLMTRAGVTFVTLGVFSWSWLEPEPGRYEFGWLDEVMDLLADASIAVDLATGTASPPPWFSHRYPESLPVTREGVRLAPGSRQAWCPSSPVFLQHATALTEQMARRYHDHPALALWHVSNEYGCHHLPCWCDVCAAGFRDWLQERYQSLEGLNDAWGTAFWSQRYTEWEQVCVPRATPAFGNPGQALDFWRYGSAALLRQFTAERDVLHRLSPGVPVTTNFMTMDHFRLLEYAEWAKEVDVVSTDHYVVHASASTSVDPRAELAFAADLTRGLSGGRPWMLMEHSTSATNWQPVNEAKVDGQLLRDSLTHVARGADTLGFFQWRASQAGAEKFHSAMVPHAGPDSQVFREVTRLGEVCARLGELVGSRVLADVALIWDYTSAWACGLDAHPSVLVDAGTVAHELHASLREQGVTVDVVPPHADLASYAVVVVPTLYLCDTATAAAVAAAAESGAQVLVTYFSGIVDEQDHIRLGGYPGAFRELLGVRVQEFHPLPLGSCVALDDGSTGTLWTEAMDVVDVAATEVVARYADGSLTGGPALTRRRVGHGAAWYSTTRLDRSGTSALTRRLCEASGVVAPVTNDGAVEVVRRRLVDDDGAHTWRFLINHGRENAAVDLPGHDLVTDRRVDGAWTLEPGDVAVVREG